MFTPNEQQIAICLVKSNLEAIEEELIVQNTVAIPILDKENDKLFRKIMNARSNARMWHKEKERLEQEHMKLTTQRMQLELQTETLSKNLELAHQKRDQLTESLKQEILEIEQIDRQHNDFLLEKAEQFRKTHRYYNEEEINREIEDINKLISVRKDELSKKQNVVDGLRAEMDAIRPEVPEDLLDQVGKLELESQVKLLTEKQQELEEKLKAINKYN